jgi:hypothetical protein
MSRKGDWMQTYLGEQFWPLDPRPSEIHIVDIAHALSNMCRYGGHVTRFYSVAEHSVILSYYVPEEYAFTALMHDSSEAYLVDIPRPIKGSLSNYKEIEFNLMIAIANHFGFRYPLPPEVSDADNRILLDERDELMRAPPASWNVRGEKLGCEIFGYPPAAAKRRFLERFEQLKGSRVPRLIVRNPDERSVAA